MFAIIFYIFLLFLGLFLMFHGIMYGVLSMCSINIYHTFPKVSSIFSKKRSKNRVNLPKAKPKIPKPTEEIRSQFRMKNRRPLEKFCLGFVSIFTIFIGMAILSSVASSLSLDHQEKGCDAQGSDEINARKEFDLIHIINTELQEACPGIVYCTDASVLTAGEGLLMAGEPFYPLHTGLRDITDSFSDVETYEHLSETMNICPKKGAHSIGVIHWKFFQNRLYNFRGADGADALSDTDFLYLMRLRCRNSYSYSPSTSPAPAPCFDGSPSSSPKESGIEMDYEGPSSGFGPLYCCGVLKGRCVVYANQQLAGEETGSLVRVYASDKVLFQRDFAQTRMKLSNLQS